MRGVVPDEVYEVFVDWPDVEPTCAHAQGVEKTRIVEVFNDFGKQMRFVFNYGEEWEFFVTLIENHPPKQGQKLPHVIKSVGQAPEQSPATEDEDWTKAMKFVQDQVKQMGLLYANRLALMDEFRKAKF